MSFKVKINFDNITYGPKDDEVDALSAIMYAEKLMQEGYRKTSNAYCSVARIDREDWLDVMARDRNCTRADFYAVNGTGIPDHHRDYYVRVYSEDVHTVHPAIARLVKGY